MQEVFKDEPTSQPLHEPEKGKILGSDLNQQNQETLAIQQDPFQFFLWILLLLIILLFTFYHFFRS